MSTSLDSRSDDINEQYVEIEFTPEQTKVLAQAPGGKPGNPELEPLPIEILVDTLSLPLHERMSPEDAPSSHSPSSSYAMWSEGELLLCLPETEATALEGESLSPLLVERIALESDATPLPTSQKKAPESNAQCRRPLRTGQVALLVSIVLLAGLLGGIAYVSRSRERPIQLAEQVDPKPAPVVEERAPTVPSASDAVVRIQNPFDRTEFFEFPAGTSAAQAREAVTKLLTERARERLPILAEAPHRRGATAKHETRGS
jgi:hypothetical protein